MVTTAPNQSSFRRFVHTTSVVLLGLAAFQWLLRVGLILIAISKRGVSGVITEMIDVTIRATGNPGVTETTALLFNGALLAVTALLALLVVKTR